MLEGRGLPGNFRVAGARWGGWSARCRRRPNPTSLCWKGILPGNPRKVWTRGWRKWPSRRDPGPTSLCWKGATFLGIPGRLGRAVCQAAAAAPTRPAFAGRGWPSWESQEGWDARLAKLAQPPRLQPNQLMLEGRDLPGNPRKVRTRGWPNRRRPNPTSLCWKGMAFLGIPGRLGRAVGEIGQTAAVPAQPAYAGRVRPPWESQEGWHTRLAKPPPP